MASRLRPKGLCSRAPFVYIHSMTNFALSLLAFWGKLIRQLLRWAKHKTFTRSVRATSWRSSYQSPPSMAGAALLLRLYILSAPRHPPTSKLEREHQWGDHDNP
ncbi:uncharacterized protein BDV14DRAFT_97127 [Aspergillus stella-maris]|uniref:uncharacterized protein n=1 Tax=Aspergillus stella-maris TaxID=1810926 RepID=UPI003CCDE5B6